MTSAEIKKRREKVIIYSFGIVFVLALVLGSRTDRKEKYKVDPNQIIKGIQDAREGR